MSNNQVLHKATMDKIVECLGRDTGCFYNLLQLVADNCPHLVELPEFVEARQAERLSRTMLKELMALRS